MSQSTKTKQLSLVGMILVTRRFILKVYEIVDMVENRLFTHCIYDLLGDADHDQLSHRPLRIQDELNAFVNNESL